MSGAALPLTLEAACELSLDAFLNSVDDDQCAKLIAVLVEILMGQQVRLYAASLTRRPVAAVACAVLVYGFR